MQQQQQQQQTNYANVSSPGMSVDPTIHDQYSYVDVNGVIQGPFQFFQIQEWIQQGHFTPSVHLRQGNVGNQSINAEKSVVTATGPNDCQLADRRREAKYIDSV